MATGIDEHRAVPGAWTPDGSRRNHGAIPPANEATFLAAVAERR